jgi:hypothetical protein
MAFLEESFLSTQQLLPLIWWRFIDDIFMIWAHTREELSSFIKALNSYHESLKFTTDISETSANFLDVTLKKNGNKIETTVYTKPTDAHMYLHYTSFHPQHQKISIPYSQAIRIGRICSSNESFIECTEKLKINLSERGYPINLIKKAIEKAAQLDRNKLLAQAQNNNKSDQIITIPFIHTHNPIKPPIKRILQKFEKILLEIQLHNS